MNNTNPFLRKIIYIACIGGLLIPLSMVSRPETRDEKGDIKDPGGMLSSLRDKHDLSQAKMSDIDPASETMKLASLGLRGVAVNALWMQAMEHKKNENYDQLASTLQALTKIQPSFVKVWEFQAHNLAYNVSMEFDDYEYRYAWVKKGLAFLKQGIPYNKRDHRVPSKLGFFTGNKFGKSDEKLSFRRMFRIDDEFHQEMSDLINPDDYDEPSFDGHDSWKMAYEWYDFSRKMVEEQSCPQREGDMLFYMYRPSMVRNQGLSLQNEFRSDESLQEVWRRAVDEWEGYGQQEISNTIGITITLEGMAKNDAEIKILRDKLDVLAKPGTREEMMKDLFDQAELTDSQKDIMAKDPGERTDEENLIAREINNFLMNVNGNIDSAVGLEVAEENLVKAEKLVNQINELIFKNRTIDKNADTINYRYWRARNVAEANSLTITAREEMYDAEEMWKQSIYDDEFDFDYKTKKKTVTKEGAITRYLNAFAKWAEVLELYPELKKGALSDELRDKIVVFKGMLDVTNREWPEEFPLQDFIDFRFVNFAQDGLPTSEALEELKSGRIAAEEARKSGEEIGARPDPGMLAPPTIDPTKFNPPTEIPKPITEKDLEQMQKDKAKRDAEQEAERIRRKKAGAEKAKADAKKAEAEKTEADAKKAEAEKGETKESGEGDKD